MKVRKFHSEALTILPRFFTKKSQYVSTLRTGKNFTDSERKEDDLPENLEPFKNSEPIRNLEPTRNLQHASRNLEPIKNMSTAQARDYITYRGQCAN
jgi:hypothetical protein